MPLITIIFFLRMAEYSVEYRSIVILGKFGSGKATLANKLIGEEVFETNQGYNRTDLNRKRVFRGRKERFDFFVLLVDIHEGTISDEQVWSEVARHFELPVKTSKQNAIDSYSRRGYQDNITSEGINLLLFVRERDSFSIDENKTFEKVCSSLSDEMKAQTAMVITHCEQDGKKGRQQYLEEMQQDCADLLRIANFGDRIYTVGFPKLETCDADFRDIFKDKMQKDEDMLMKLVERMTQLVLPHNFFQRTPAPKELHQPIDAKRYMEDGSPSTEHKGYREGPKRRLAKQGSMNRSIANCPLF